MTVSEAGTTEAKNGVGTSRTSSTAWLTKSLDPLVADIRERVADLVKVPIRPSERERARAREGGREERERERERERESARVKVAMRRSTSKARKACAKAQAKHVKLAAKHKYNMRLAELKHAAEVAD